MKKLTFFLIFSLFCILTAFPVSAYDFTLSVYGNANMDDIIDEDDITYVERIIKGTQEKTQFADANYDGIVNDEDISHIESILAGEKTDVTMVDSNGRTTTVTVPVERLVAAYPGVVTLASNLDSFDKIVGADINSIKNADSQLFGQAHPDVKDLPPVGSFTDINLEQVISLKPDLIFSFGTSSNVDVADDIQKKTGVPVFYPKYQHLKYDDEGGHFETWRQAGIIFGKQERAEELISYWNEEINKVKEIVGEIPEEDIKTVYLGGFSKAGFEGTLNQYDPIDIAGGENLASSLQPNSNTQHVVISKEQIIKWNPDVILSHRTTNTPNYPVEDILADPTLQSINAVKNGKVCYIRVAYQGLEPAGELTECVYLAKLLYPDQCSGLNVESEGNEILQKFYGKNGLYSWVENYFGLNNWN